MYPDSSTGQEKMSLFVIHLENLRKTHGYIWNLANEIGNKLEIKVLRYLGTSSETSSSNRCFLPYCQLLTAYIDDLKSTSPIYLLKLVAEDFYKLSFSLDNKLESIFFYDVVGYTTQEPLVLSVEQLASFIDLSAVEKAARDYYKVAANKSPKDSQRLSFGQDDKYKDLKLHQLMARVRCLLLYNMYMFPIAN